MDKLTRLIDQMVHEKTFSMEGVEAIKDLRDQAKVLEDRVAELSEVNKNERGRVDVLKAEHDKLKDEVGGWKRRDAALIERETKVTELEKASAVANAKAETYKECIGLVFRNTTLRREMFGQQPVTDNTGYSTSQPTSETVTETVD